MSFGVSAGDFALLGQLAFRIYKACKDAPDSFKNLSQEVSSLHMVLKEVEETLSDSGLSAPQQSRLQCVGDGCRVVLENLQCSLDKYNSLGTKSKRTWDRLGWGSKDIAELRSRLISNTVMLTTLVNTFQINVHKKLDMIKQKYQDGKHEGSMVSTQTVETLSADEQQAWRAIRKELENIGISVEAFEAKKDFILNWLRIAISTGAFEEQTSEAETSSMLDEYYLSQSWEDLRRGTPKAFDEQTWEAEISSMLDEYDLRQSWEDPRLTNLCKQHLEDPETGTNLTSPSIKPQESRFSSESLRMLVFRKKIKFRKVVQSGGEPKIRELLEEWVDINMSDDDGMTLLHHAVCTNSEDIVRLLSREGAELLTRNEFRHTALHMAVEKGDYRESMAQLLLDNGAEINSKDIYGRTALHLAADFGDEKVVKLLLNHGAKVEEKDNDDGYTALNWAVRAGQVTVVQLLLENGAIVVGEDRRGLTLLHYAISLDDESEALLMSQLLLKHGANPNETTSAVMTALIWAVSIEREKIVQNLLAYERRSTSTIPLE
ncbi:hypothetical protein MMC07_007652 [Pseudocyphellaria aurata]|nr:hypothetical protein [Pseudocyphellaria aurata]